MWLSLYFPSAHFLKLSSLVILSLCVLLTHQFDVIFLSKPAYVFTLLIFFPRFYWIWGYFVIRSVFLCLFSHCCFVSPCLPPISPTTPLLLYTIGLQQTSGTVGAWQEPRVITNCPPGCISLSLIRTSSDRQTGTLKCVLRLLSNDEYESGYCTRQQRETDAFWLQNYLSGRVKLYIKSLRWLPCLKKDYYIGEIHHRFVYVALPVRLSGWK